MSELVTQPADLQETLSSLEQAVSAGVVSPAGGVA
jgi:hypothetical protein